MRTVHRARSHSGTVVVGGEVAGENVAARVGATGIAAVQQAGLTTWDQATLLKRV